jgi:MFS family permease
MGQSIYIMEDSRPRANGEKKDARFSWTLPALQFNSSGPSGKNALSSPRSMSDKGPRNRWLNRTVLGIGLASLFSDWSHEIATTLMPAFLATMGVAAAWLGMIEGVSDGLASFAKMGSGYYTDRLRRRKPIAVGGYVVTALGTAAFGLATSAWHVLVARSFAWLGRGVRTPVRKALLAGSVTKETYGRAFGFERMMDTIGAIVGPASAFLLLPLLHYHYPTLFALTLIPGMIAVALIAFLVKEKGARAGAPRFVW